MLDVCTINDGQWSEMSSSASCSQPLNSPALEEEASESVHADTAKRPRLTRTKAKPLESNIEMAKLTLLKQVHSTLSAANNDSLEVFGQQVANELRNIKDKAVQLRLRRNIMNMLYDAQEAEQASQYQPLFVGPSSSQSRPYTPVPVQYQVYKAPQQSPQRRVDHQSQSQPPPLSFVRLNLEHD